jgi:hypothetical protein
MTNDMLPETDPYHVYVIVQGAGIVSEGRPIRGNYYNYRLDRKHADTVRDLLGHRDPFARREVELLAFLREHNKEWCQEIDDEGYPRSRNMKRRNHTATDPLKLRGHKA